MKHVKGHRDLFSGDADDARARVAGGCLLKSI